MTHLEKLTLDLRTCASHSFPNDPILFVDDTNPFIDGTRLHNGFLVHMPQFCTFNFYISTENLISPLLPRKSNDDILRTFTNTIYGHTACITDYFNGDHMAICHVYSLPFTFTRLANITTHFPTIIFDTVTHLYAYDMISMKHEFFMRISRAFPLLKCFSIENDANQYRNHHKLKFAKNSSYSIIEYPHLTSLDIIHANIDYAEQFLPETKMHLPRLTELKINYYVLKIVTMNFTRDETRHNCSKVKRLLVEGPRVFSKDAYEYFPSL